MTLKYLLHLMLNNGINVIQIHILRHIIINSMKTLALADKNKINAKNFCDYEMQIKILDIVSAE